MLRGTVENRTKPYYGKNSEKTKRFLCTWYTVGRSYLVCPPPQEEEFRLEYQTHHGALTPNWFAIGELVYTPHVIEACLNRRPPAFRLLFAQYRPTKSRPPNETIKALKLCSGRGWIEIDVFYWETVYSGKLHKLVPDPAIYQALSYTGIK